MYNYINYNQIMVKNLTGGTKTKGLARKHQNANQSSKLQLPECELEQIACVSKMLGNGMCEIYTNENVRLIGHIRNKFRGRQKRHNTISANMVVLIGLREWESIPKNCDILTIYDDRHLDTLKKLPNINMNNVLNRITASTSFQNTDIESDINFCSKYTEEEEEEEQQTTKIANEFTKFAELETELDIDDI